MLVVDGNDAWDMRTGAIPRLVLQAVSYFGTVTVCLALACGMASRDTVPPAVDDELGTATQELGS
ncbi:hypothetical protein GCM10023339_40190 [Alloalcanivorax gelatiniphagus]